MLLFISLFPLLFSHSLEFPGNDNLLQQFKDSLPENSPYKEQVFGHEYVMESVPYIDESSRDYQARVRRVPIKKNHILVLIPSYRDPDCHMTITDMMARCAKCDRVRVGMLLLFFLLVLVLFEFWFL
jgi:hypothetical protein